MCGMIGSNMGWRAVSYVRCPAAKRELAARVETVSEAGPPVRIIPGLVCDGIAHASDVMRGEETQLLGWIEKQAARSEGRHVICHPGTHAKWALIEDGRITRFCTAMTGELYDVLSTHSLLRAEDEIEDDLAFQQGVSAAGDGDALSLRLFTARSRIVAGGAPKASSASYLSGLLIGSEIGAAPRMLGLTESQRICVLGAPDLRRHYARALSLRGFKAWEEDGADAVLAGFAALVALGALDEA
jgi:2-dehydro-3-deoxygalactonokinase